MKVPDYARYDYCYYMACSFLEEHKVDSYPIDVLNILENKGIKVGSYSQLMELQNFTLEDVCSIYKSSDGRTFIHPDGKYTILYNDIGKTKERIRFTLMHELGHIYLDHLVDFELATLDRKTDKQPHEILNRWEYKVLENEANAFARNVLAPVSLVYFLQKRNAYQVEQHFGLSSDAAIVRINMFNLDCSNSKRLGIGERLLNIFNTFFYKRICSICKAKIVQKKGLFCPICGSKNSLKKENESMEYKNYITNSDGFLEECIHCKNEDIKGDYCHICSSPARNYCSNHYYAKDNYDTCNHSEPLSGNARFCPDCGSESIFYRRKILPSWEIEYKEFMENEKIENELQAYPAYDNWMNIPDANEVDDELPFN